MQSKNALGNLKNRYIAVLKKCHLLNTFGSLAVASILALGGVVMPTDSLATSFPMGGGESDYYIIQKDVVGTYYKEFSVTDSTGTTTTYGLSFQNPVDSTTYTTVSDLLSAIIPHDVAGQYTIKLGRNSGDYILPVGTGPIVAISAQFHAGARPSSRIPELTASITQGNFYKNILIGDDKFNGGAIVNTSKNDYDIFADFISCLAPIENFSTVSGLGFGNGGAIYNTGTLGNISGNFIDNISADRGGAIFNTLDATINALTQVTFIGNHAQGKGMLESSVDPVYSTGGGALGNSGTIKTLNNATFINNNSGVDGGAIQNEGIIEEITYTTFTGNSSDSSGGAISNFHSEISLPSPVIKAISNVTFTGNIARNGGAIYSNGSITALNNTSFTGNSAYSGGAIYANGIIDEITNATFIGNSAQSSGGAIQYATSHGNSIITNSAFIGNSAHGGGAIYFNLALVDTNISNSTFMGNNSTDDGGAIYYSASDATNTLTNSAFIGNTGETGGAVYYAVSSMTTNTISNSAFLGNTAKTGGAISNSGRIETLTSTVFKGNKATDGSSGALTSSNNGIINFIAANADTGGLTLFSGNTDSSGNLSAITNGGVLNFNAGVNDNNMGIIDVQGAIIGFGSKQPTLNVNGTVYKIDNITPMAAPTDGLVLLDKVSNHNFTQHAGGLSFADGVAEEEVTDSIFTTLNGSVLYVDADLGNDVTKTDSIDATSGDVAGTVAFRMVSDDSNDSETTNIFDSTITTANADYATAYTNDYSYTYDGATFTQTDSTNGLENAINAGDIRTFSLTGNSGIGGTLDDAGTLTLFGNVQDALADTLANKYGTELYSIQGANNSLTVNNADTKLNIIDMHMDGGTIANMAGTVLIYNSAFENNITSLNNQDKTFVFNSIFNENTARAINNSGNALQLTNVNLTGNTHTTQGGAIYSTADILLHSQAGDYTISGNYVSQNNGASNDYNAIYMDGVNKNITFQLDAASSYTLDDSIRGSGAYNVNIIGSGTLHLNNALYGASSVTIDGSTLNLGTASYGYADLDSATLTVTNGKVNVSVDSILQSNLTLKDSLLTLHNGSTLTLEAGFSADNGSVVDISGGELTTNMQSFGTVSLSEDNTVSFIADGTVSTQLIADTNTQLVLNNYGGSNVLLDHSEYASLLLSISNDIFGSDIYADQISLNGISFFQTLDIFDLTQTGSDVLVGAGTYSSANATVFAGILDNRSGTATSKDSIINTTGSLSLSGNGPNALSVGNIDVQKGTLNLGYDGANVTAGGNIAGNLMVGGGSERASVVAWGTDNSVSGDVIVKVNGNLNVNNVDKTASLQVTGAIQVSGGSNAGVNQFTVDSGTVTAAKLELTAGGTANVNGAFTATGAEGVTVSGKKSAADVSEFSVHGSFEAQKLAIREGGSVDVAGNAIAFNITGAEGISIDGAGSTFSTSMDVSVDKLTMTNGGAINIANNAATVEVGSIVNLEGGSMSVGTGTLEAAGFTNNVAELVLTQGVLKTTNGMSNSKAVTLNGGNLEIAGGTWTAGDDVTVIKSSLIVSAGTVDVSAVNFTVDNTATAFNVNQGATLKMNGDNFITFNGDGSLSANLGKALENDGTLVLTDLADEIGAVASRSRKAQLNAELKDGFLLSTTSTGTVDYADVTFDGLYSLTWVDEADTAFQNESQNIMAGDFTGNRTVNAAGIVKNTDTDPDLTDSTIAASNTLNLSGKNAGNILLDEGSLTNSGTLNLGATDVATAYFNGTLTTSSGATTNVLSNVTTSKMMTVENGGMLDIKGGTLDVTAGLTADAADLSSAAGTTLVVNNATIGSNELGIANEANATVTGASANALLGNVTITGFNGTEENPLKLAYGTTTGGTFTSGAYNDLVNAAQASFKAAFLPEDYPMMQNSTGQFIKAMGDSVGFDTDSQNTGIKFISRAIDDRYMDVENKNLMTSTVEGALQMASVGAVAGTALDVTKAGNRAISQQNNLSASMNENGQNGMSSSNTGSKYMQNGFGAWLTPIYGHANASGFDSGSFDSGYQSNFGGTAIGADYTINNSLRFGFGVNVGAGSSESKGDFNKTENDFDYLGGALYASYFMDNFAVSADISYTALDGELEQKLPVSMGMNKLKSDVDSDVFSLGVMAEYRFNLEHFDLTPYMGLRYSHVATDGYSIHSADATGSGQVAKVASDSQNVFSIPVGVTISKEIETASGWGIAPKMELGVVANFGDLEATSKASIADVPSVSTLKMDNVDGFAFMGGLGIEVKKDNLSLNLNYHLEASEHKQNHGVFANIEYKF